MNDEDTASILSHHTNYLPFLRIHITTGTLWSAGAGGDDQTLVGIQAVAMVFTTAIKQRSDTTKNCATYLTPRALAC